MTSGNNDRKKVVFLTADQMEKLADVVARHAKQLHEEEERRTALSLAARFRVYATMKRALTPQTRN
jgi:hypothetical protein